MVKIVRQIKIGSITNENRLKNLKRLVIGFVVSLLLIWNCLEMGRKDLCFETLLAGPILPDNPAFIKVIRKKFLIEPSRQPYNILGKKNIATKSIEDSQRFYRNASQILFNNKTNGFFIEAGALDGETMSNTLNLEIQQNWTGLLIEPDPVSFRAMVNKKRKAWLANVALSPYTYPTQKLLGVQPQYVDTDAGALSFGFKMRAMHGLPEFTRRENLQTWHFYVQCLPLESLLHAIGIYKVDLLSLDVEGPELDILKNFPFDKFDIQVIYIELKVLSSFVKLQLFMSSKGFRKFNRYLEDNIFIKIGSPYENM